MFWCSAFARNKLHALAHPQPLSWMVAPQAGSAAGTLRLGCVRRWCRVQASGYRLQSVSDVPAPPAPLDLAGFLELTRPHRVEAEP